MCTVEDDFLSKFAGEGEEGGWLLAADMDIVSIVRREWLWLLWLQ